MVCVGREERSLKAPFIHLLSPLSLASSLLMAIFCNSSFELVDTQEMCKSFEVLCSDYNPTFMLYAPFVLAKKGLLRLSEAANMVSLNPAKAIGMDTIGSIEVGKRADMVLIDEMDGIPLVLKTIVNGKLIYDVEPRF